MLQFHETSQKHNILDNPTDKGEKKDSGGVKSRIHGIANKPARKDFKVFIVYYFIFICDLLNSFM